LGCEVDYDVSVGDESSDQVAVGDVSAGERVARILFNGSCVGDVRAVRKIVHVGDSDIVMFREFVLDEVAADEAQTTRYENLQAMKRALRTFSKNLVSQRWALRREESFNSKVWGRRLVDPRRRDGRAQEERR